MGWCLAINFFLWLLCIIAGMALGLDTHGKEILKRRTERLSLVLLQMLWMQAMVVNVSATKLQLQPSKYL